jgi:Right handed beta helix region
MELLEMKFAVSFLALIAFASPLGAQSRAAPFTLAETGQGFNRLQDAVTAIGAARGTIIIAPGTYRDCAMQTQGAITYKSQIPGAAIFDRGICDGKAALVLSGQWARIDGIIFQNMRVADKNGSGVRLQKGDLEVFNATFRNSEQGILSHDDNAHSITIDRSTFSGLGGCPDGMCSHSIYIGDYGRLVVTNSRFERGTGGHYVKARAGLVEIRNNSFDDTRGFETNYMIDLPAGSRGAIVGNEFVQGENKENYSAFIAVGAESISHSSTGLVISNNHASIAPGVRRSTTFVADWTKEPLRILANQLGAGLKLFETR